MEEDGKVNGDGGEIMRVRHRLLLKEGICGKTEKKTREKQKEG